MARKLYHWSKWAAAGTQMVFTRYASLVERPMASDAVHLTLVIESFITPMVMCNGVSPVCCNFGIKTKRTCMLKHCVLLLTYVKKHLVKSALQHVFSLGWYLALVGLGGSALWLNMGLLVAPTEVEGVWPVAVGAKPKVHLILALLVVNVEEQLC